MPRPGVQFYNIVVYSVCWYFIFCLRFSFRLFVAGLAIVFALSESRVLPVDVLLGDWCKAVQCLCSLTTTLSSTNSSFSPLVQVVGLSDGGFRSSGALVSIYVSGARTRREWFHVVRRSVMETSQLMNYFRCFFVLFS